MTTVGFTFKMTPDGRFTDVKEVPMTKLEQVARAIQQSDFEDGGIPWEHINPPGQSDYRKYARVAVEALRSADRGFNDVLDEILAEKPE